MQLYQLGRFYAKKAFFPAFDGRHTAAPLDWFGEHIEMDRTQLVLDYGLSPATFARQSLEGQKQIMQGVVDFRAYVADDSIHFNAASKEAASWIVSYFKRAGFNAEQRLDKTGLRRSIPGNKPYQATVFALPKEIKKVLS